jgi:hypothetical protein
MNLCNVYDIPNELLQSVVEAQLNDMGQSNHAEKGAMISAGVRYLNSLIASYNHDLAALAEITLRGWLRGDWSNASPWMVDITTAGNTWERSTRHQLELLANQLLSVRHNKYLARRLNSGSIHVIIFCSCSTCIPCHLT